MNQPILVRDLYLQKIRPFVNIPIIKILTGMRRVGKSVLLQSIRDHLISIHVSSADILYINKESLEFDNLKTYKDLYVFVVSKLKKGYLFVDEIQLIDQWEKAINSLLSEGNIDIYITGSTANMMSSELSTLLAGRHVVFDVFPLSFNEYIMLRRLRGDASETGKLFNNYLKYGGLPGLHYFDDSDVMQDYLSSIISSSLLKDVIQRHHVRDSAQLERLVRFVMDNCGNITSAKSISDYARSQHLPIAVETIQHYLSYLQQAFLVRKVMRFDLQGKRYLELLEKYYLGDIGLRFGYLGYKDRDVSKILENIIYLELLTRGFQVSVGVFGVKEIDFIAEKNDQRLYIQVCYLLSSEETLEREFSSLKKIDDFYPRLVLSMDQGGLFNRNGIQHKNVLDFLLER